MRSVYWSADVCSSDLSTTVKGVTIMASESVAIENLPNVCPRFVVWEDDSAEELSREERAMIGFRRCLPDALKPEFDKLLADDGRPVGARLRSEEHTSELQSLMRSSYAVF